MELLVVMAIIAVLVSVLLPALSAARQYAAGSVCLNNQKQLSIAWFTYQDDNEGRLCGGHTEGYYEHDWMQPYPGIPSVAYTLDGEKQGLRNGVLFPYVMTVEVYHCPGDRRDIDDGNCYRSYSIADCMGACPDGPSYWAGPVTTKFNQISHPAAKDVFIEEDDPRQFNRGTWCLDYVNGISGSWVDPVAIWHNDASTLGFADGHAELHHWVDAETVEMADYGIFFRGDTSGPDIKYMLAGWNVWDRSD